MLRDSHEKKPTKNLAHRFLEIEPTKNLSPTFETGAHVHFDAQVKNILKPPF